MIDFLRCPLPGVSPNPFVPGAHYRVLRPARSFDGTLAVGEVIEYQGATYDTYGGEYVYVDGGWDSIGPSSAPPEIRVERYDSRPGFVWVSGNWNWDGGQWVWVNGHYERERRGHRWRQSRWEQQNGAWISVTGGWE